MSDDLVTKLRNLGPDDSGFREVGVAAAQALTEARAEIETKTQAIHLLDERCAQYERRANAAESELATLRDMLILCGELGGMQPGETMADYLRRLIDEVAGKETERELAKSAAITAYLAQREKEGWVMVPVEPSCDQLVAGMEAWGRLDDAEEEVEAIYTEMIAQNGGEPCK